MCIRDRVKIMVDADMAAIGLTTPSGDVQSTIQDQVRERTNVAVTVD